MKTKPNTINMTRNCAQILQIDWPFTGVNEIKQKKLKKMKMICDYHLNLFSSVPHLLIQCDDDKMPYLMNYEIILL